MESLVDLVTSDRPDDLCAVCTGHHLNNCTLGCSGNLPGDSSDDQSDDRCGYRTNNRSFDRCVSLHPLSSAHHKYYKSLLLSCQPQAKAFWAFFLKLPQFQVYIIIFISCALSQEGRGDWAVYYTSPQSFNTFSCSLA